MEGNRQILCLADRGLKTLPSQYCTDTRIRTLQLDKNKLSSLPEELSYLRQLEDLQLSCNLFTTFPSCICSLKHLQNLDMSENYLLTLPEEFCRLENLRTLNLADNRLTEIPAAVTTLRNLMELDMSENSLRAIHPGIGKLQNLTTLVLDNNSIQELPEEMFTLRLLSSLHLEANELKSIHPMIAKLSNLSYLDCSANRLECLPDMGALKNLTRLILDENEISVLPQSVTGLWSLKQLSLRKNKLDDLPPEIGQLRNLRQMDLRSNRIQTKTLIKIMHITSLEDLDLGYNAIHCIPVEVLSNLKFLNKFYLKGNAVRYPPLDVCVRGSEEMKKYFKAHPMPDMLTRLEREDDNNDDTQSQGTYFILPDKIEQRIPFNNYITMVVPPGSVKGPIEFTAKLAQGEVFRPTLEKNHNFESDIIDLEPYSVSFSTPVMLEFRVNVPAGVHFTVMSSDDGIRWNNHIQSIVTTDGRVTCLIKKLGMFVLVSSPLQEEFLADPRGCTFRSTICRDVTIDVLPGAVDTLRKFTVEVLPMESTVTEFLDQHYGLENELSLSPIVFMKCVTNQNVLVKLTIPLPRGLPGSESDVHIVNDREGTEEWHVVTDEVDMTIQDTTATCVVAPFSGYLAARTTKQAGLDIGMHVASVYRNVTRGIKVANILLLQHIQNPEKILLEVVEKNKMPAKIKKYKMSGYEPYMVQLPHSEDFLIQSRQKVSFQASDGFKINSPLKYLTFFPNQENFIEVTVKAEKSEELAAKPNLEGSMSFVKLTMCDAESGAVGNESQLVAKLKFTLGKRVKVKKSPTEILQTLQKRVSVVTSELQGSGKDWIGSGRLLGLSNDQLETIRSEYKEEKECVHQVFLAWGNMETDESTNQGIIESFRAQGFSRMTEAAEKVVAEESDMDSAIIRLGEDLPVREWKHFARKGLNLTPEDVDSIDVDFANEGVGEKKYRTLLLWRRRKGHSATVESLANALEKCNLQQQADMLKREFINTDINQ
ncbi:p53-induced death domain-containing protein 1-like [Ptychodera flava]|uniref:p53-induced death domain-containing protein 1-like n=1 Tax=Ptychodera flava TaxID=63121 RepID=UPI003969FA50